MRKSFEVLVRDGLEREFLAHHQKAPARAVAVWHALQRNADVLATDPFAGTQIPKDRFPDPLAQHDNLWKLNLPHAFRAVYSVLARPHGRPFVGILWLGSHAEYDRLFGYA